MKMKAGTTLLLLLLLLFSASGSAQWSLQPSRSNARLRGLGVVSGQVAWASGSGGTCLRTIDGGKTWHSRGVPGGDALDFRDVHAVDGATAYLLSAGEGEKSRIYRTGDRGTTWTLQHTNTDPSGFLDAIAFWDAGHGLALGDPVDGRFVILLTDDGGNHWTRLPAGAMPPSLPGEGAFAASGTCLLAQGDRNAWFATGGATVARIFRSTDRGRTWTVHDTPVRAGTPSSGIFSLAFWDADHGVAIGGDYLKPDRSGRLVARTSDGGRTWVLEEGSQPAGYRSGVAVVPGAPGPTLVAVGPTGTDVSSDGGKTWRPSGVTGFDAVSFASPSAGWAVGEAGKIAWFAGSDPDTR